MSEGFDAFVLARGHALLRFAHVLCGDRHLAEDLLQEVLARVHRRWDRVEAMDGPEAYVRKALVREFLSWRRRRSSTETAMAELPDRVAEADLAHDLAQRDEVWALLGRLPRAQRAVLSLRYYADMSDTEIAATLGCTTGSVRGHASRALARLRSTLQDPGAAAMSTKGGRHERA